MNYPITKHKILAVFITVIFTSATCICPAAAIRINDYTDIHPGETTNINKNEYRLEFKNADGITYSIHEKAGVIDEITIGEKQAVLIDTPTDKDYNTKTISLGDGQFLEVFKSTKKLALYQQSPDGMYMSTTSIISYPEDNNNNNNNNNKIIPQIKTLEKTYQPIITAAVIMGLTLLNPVMGVGYVVAMYLIQPSNAMYQLAAVGVVELIAVGAALVAVIDSIESNKPFPIDAIKTESIKPLYDDKGTATFAVAHNGKYYLYTHNKYSDNKHATFVKELGPVEGFAQLVSTESTKVMGHISNGVNYIMVRIDHLAGKENYYIRYKKNLNKNEDQISYGNAVIKMNECEDNTFIYSTEEGCRKLCKEVSKLRRDGKPVYENHSDHKGKQYMHCHPNTECHSHCLWGNKLPNKKTDL